MIESVDITFSVRSRTLVSHVSAQFAPGKLHLIIGPNGAGKSTLIKLLSRSLRPQSGSIRYEGTDIRNENEIELAKRRAVLSQAVEVAFPLSVREVVMMGRYPHFGGRPGPVDSEIVAKMMGFFDVTELADRDYLTLSGGERQRVNFARVLGQLWRQDEKAGKCRYLFLDEPLTFLDIHHQIEFMKKVREFASQPDVVTVGVVHDLNLAARFADRLIVIDGGRLVESGTPDEVLTVNTISKVFNVCPTFFETDHGTQFIFD